MDTAVRFTDVLPPPGTEGWPGPLSLEIQEGTFALFVVTPGTGLSLIRMIVGLREPRAGAVEVLGVQPGQLNRWDTQQFRRRLGVGFDEPSGLVSNLTLRMNMVVPMLYSGLRDAATARDAASALIATFGLERWAEVRPADMPPEIRREAVVARAVVREPDLLVLEEPTSGLRDIRAGWLLSVCRQHARTMIMTTAEREGVQYEHADRIITVDTSGIEVRRNEVGVV